MLLVLVAVLLVVFLAMPGRAPKGSTWAWLAAALIALPFVGMLFMHGFGFGGRGYGYGMMGRGGGMMGPWGGMMGPGYFGPLPGVWQWVIMGVVIVGLGFLVWFLLKQVKAAAPAAEEDEAVQHLRMRLARGEISADEYDALYQKLKG